jgi:hypothetical protein
MINDVDVDVDVADGGGCVVVVTLLALLALLVLLELVTPPLAVVESLFMDPDPDPDVDPVDNLVKAKERRLFPPNLLIVFMGEILA